MADTEPVRNTSVRNRRGNPTEMTRKIGESIRKRRRELGWNQEELAAKIGIGADTISRYEAGITEVNASGLPKIAEALGVPVTYFYAALVPVPTVPRNKKKVALKLYSLPTEVIVRKDGKRYKVAIPSVDRDVAPDNRESELLKYFEPLAENLKDAVIVQTRALYNLQFGCTISEGEKRSDEQAAEQAEVG